MPNLAVLILTKNEAHNIAETVRIAASFSDEVIVLDSGSTDDTVAVAENAGAKTAFRAWDGDFSAQRNYALTLTEARWVLYLDADERPDETLAESIREAVKPGAPGRQYALPRRCVAFGTEFRHGVLAPDEVLRLFPKSAVTWKNRVHEHPECVLEKQTLGGVIRHHTYRNWEDWERKLCLYTTIWAEDANKRGKRTSLPGIFTHSLGAFFKMFFSKLGFLDGWMGFHLCCTHFFYTMLKYLKLYELQRKA